MERLWPALQGVDSSSGALGSAVNRTIEQLIPPFADAPAGENTRRKWLERLYDAVLEDGVGFRSPKGRLPRFPSGP